jgi:cobalamin biosynthetic protein CobC
MSKTPRDHGGGLDNAALQYGGKRADWIDLSTGINPLPYDIAAISPDAWTALPDQSAATQLTNAARQFWNVPKGAAILAAPGASSLIVNMPRLAPQGSVSVTNPTYNEHAAAFETAGWAFDGTPTTQVVVHPNNPDGRIWRMDEITAPLRIIDESFCDVMPEHSLIQHAGEPGTIILKSFGKFWGLAGLRLGFAIGDPDLIEQLKTMLGPWPVSGPALQIGAQALSDPDWAVQTRLRLDKDAAKLDQIMTSKGASVVGGTTLFRLYEVDDAAAWQDRLAQSHIWSRIFPYSTRWLRLGLPHPMDWARIEGAL